MKTNTLTISLEPLSPAKGHTLNATPAKPSALLHSTVMSLNGLPSPPASPVPTTPKTRKAPSSFTSPPSSMNGNPDQTNNVDTNLEKEIEASGVPSTLGVPPDGGFGWMVVFASFMCNVIVDGILFSFGFLLFEIASEFNESRGKTAWIGSLQTGFYLIVGPLVSYLANTFDCRKIAIIGSIVASLGFVLSYFATNILTLYFTFSVLGGIGFGFIFLPAIVTVGFYFEKRRAFATGIAVCGSGIGTFILPPIIQSLIEKFGWRGCLLVLAGIIMMCAFFSSFFKPLPPMPPRPVISVEIKVDEPVEDNNNTDTPKPIGGRMEKPLLMRIKEARAAQWTASDERINEESPSASQSSAPPPYSEVLDVIQLSEQVNSSRTVSLRITSHGPQKSTENIYRRRTKSALAERKDTLNTPHPNEMMYSNLSLVVPPRTRSTLNLNQGEGAEGDTAQADNIQPKGFGQSFLECFDLKLLKRPSFLLLSSSGFLCLVGFFIPFIYISDRAKLLGCSPDKCAFILSIIGVTNTIGRVFCGWASDNRVNALVLNNIALTVGGISTIVSPFVFNTYPLLIAYGSIFGFSVATFATLRLVITVKLLGLERLTSAFGLLLLFQGLAVTIGSPIAGWFFDMTGSYDYSFYLSGGAILLSGVMCYPLNAIARWEKKHFDDVSLVSETESNRENV